MLVPQIVGLIVYLVVKKKRLFWAHVIGVFMPPLAFMAICAMLEAAAVQPKDPVACGMPVLTAAIIFMAGVFMHFIFGLFLQGAVTFSLSNRNAIKDIQRIQSSHK